MSRLRAALRHHIHFIIILPLLIIVMTWPTIIYVVDTDAIWLPSKNRDVFFKLWDVWYGRQVLAGNADLLRADLQFYPQGMSLLYHQFALPHMIAVALLQALMPVSNAYNLCYLLLLFFNAAATYLLLLLIFRAKWICLFGAVLVGLHPTMVSLFSTLPDLTLIATLPLSLYFLHRSILEHRLAFAVISGLMAGATAFIGLYIFVCIALTLGFYGLCLAISRWRERRFWWRLAILFSVLCALGLVRIAPMIAHGESFNEALDKNVHYSDSIDLLGLIVLSPNPITSPFLKDLFGVTRDFTLGHGYLGFLPLLLVLLGLASAAHRRQMLPWLVLLLMFLLLGLGQSLKINRVIYPDIALPLRFLDQMFPALFRPFWNASHFYIGALVPLAALTCFGLSAIMKRVPIRRAPWLIMPLIALTALEYYSPLSSMVIAKGQTRYIEWLKTEEQESIRLINLPMGRQFSKYYNFLQSIAGYPHAEGAANRTLAESYSYIDANPLLSAWRDQKSLHCFPANAAAYKDALYQLLADGFTHALVHYAPRGSWPLHLRNPHLPPAYEDDFVHIYRLKDMLSNCRHTAFLSDNVFPQLNDILPPSAIKFRDRAAVLSIHPTAAAEGDMQRFYSLILETLPALIPLAVDDAAPSSPGANEADTDAERLLLNSNVLLLLYDPQNTPPDLIDAYAKWIPSRFKSCGQGPGAAALRLDYFANDDIPCELLTAANPFRARYENGMKLANALLRFDGEQLDLHLLWQRLAEKLHSASLQIFDETGARVAGFDRTIPHDYGPAFDLRLDLSALEPGDYIAKLIIYDYETRVDVPGAIASAGLPLDRALELARLTID